MRQAIAITAAGVIGLIVVPFTHQANGAWLATGALMVLKPGYGDTVRVALTRAVATVFGAAAAGAIAAATSQPWVLLSVAFVLTWCAEAIVRRSFAIFVVLITPLSVLLTNVLVPGDWEVAFLRVADVAAGSLLAVAISTILLLWRSTTMMRWVSRPTMGMARFRGHVLSLRAHAVQPSHAPPALMPPSQSAAAMNGSGTTQSGLRLIQ